MYFPRLVSVFFSVTAEAGAGAGLKPFKVFPSHRDDKTVEILTACHISSN